MLKRFFAFCYDLFLLFCICLIVTVLLVIASKGKGIPPNTLWFQLLLVFVTHAYFIGLWTYGKGQTIGQRAWGLTLVSQANTPPTFMGSVRHFYLGLLGFGGLRMVFMLPSSKP